MRQKISTTVLFIFLSFFSFAQGSGNWIWMKGDTSFGAGTGHGGPPISVVAPPGLSNSVYWKDKTGLCWVFGGMGYKIIGIPFVFIRSFYNYIPVSNNFTLINYANAVNKKGIYNFKGIPNIGSMPGARMSGISWTDNNGDLWLYGGIDTTNKAFNDLWRYNIATSLWTWMGGDSTTGHMPVYGNMGVPAATNSPGSREGSVTHWVDRANNLYLFGGKINGMGVGNDLWKYNVSTGLWTWINGSNIINNAGNYGVKGLAAAANLPPARVGYAATKDAHGNFLLIGGNERNDVWRYNIYSNMWTWIAGVDTLYSKGNYVGYCQNGYPAARHDWRAVQMEGKYARFSYVFGSTDSTNGSCNNDLWLFDSNTLKWIWLNGTYNNYALNWNGRFNTMAIVNPSNRIPGKQGYCLWVDSTNNLLLFGGTHCYNSQYAKNQTWKYIPDTTCFPSLICPTTFKNVNDSICKNVKYILPSGKLANSTGIYIDTLFNYTGCDSIITTHLTVLNYQYQSKSITICSNQTYTLHNGKKINTASVYYDTIPSATSCDSIYTINLLVKAASFTNLSKTICSNQSFLFNNQTLITSGVYNDTLINKNGCDSIITLNLTIKSISNSTINPIICSNQFYTLPNGLQTNKSGIYKDTLVNISGCDSFIIINLSVINLPQINLGNDTTLCAGNVIILSAPQYSLANYVWNTHSTNHSITVDTSGFYYVTIVMPPCVSVADSVKINFIDCDCKILLPNSFTPNADGIDEIFKPIIACDIEPQQYDFKIYNRLGQKVFSTTLFNAAWDGTFNGALQEVGTYVFFVSFINPTNHQQELYKGDVILLR